MLKILNALRKPIASFLKIISRKPKVPSIEYAGSKKNRCKKQTYQFFIKAQRGIWYKLLRQQYIFGKQVDVELYASKNQAPCSSTWTIITHA